MSNSFVQRLDNLSRLQETEVHLLESLCRNPRHVGSKTYIHRESSKTSRFPVLMSGWAARQQILRNGSRQITRLMLPGDAHYFEASPGSLLHEEIVTLSPCNVAHVSHREMEGAIESSASIGKAMHNYGCMENAILSSLVVNIGRRDALERMAFLICELHHRLSLIEGCVAHDTFDFPLTQDDLADALGLTPVHVNRKLQQLRQSEIIILRSRKMQILDLPQLQQIAGFNGSHLSRTPARKSPLRAQPHASSSTSQ